MRIILGILFLPLIAFYTIQFRDVICSLSFSDPIHKWFILVFIISTVLSYLYISADSYIAIFEHELTHNLWAILTFNRPEGFHVSRGIGGVFLHSGRGNFIITLSPYFFLTFSFFFLPFFIFIDADFHQLFIIILAVLTGFHTSTTIKETHLRQEDLRKYGLGFSVIVIILGNILSYGLIFSFITASWAGMWVFLRTGILELINFVSSFF